ncbi:MAG: hypothetical protein ACE5G9_00770 [Nitrospinales bacterium]
MLFQEKNRFAGLVALVLLLPFLGLPVFAETASPPRAAADPIGALEIRSFEKGVTIDVTERSLKDVLRRIQNDSGILFAVRDELGDITITARISAVDWTSAVKKLLEDFNKVELWDRGRLRRVWLLGGGDSVGRSIQKTAKVLDEADQEHKKKKIIRGRKYKIFLSEEELGEITKFPSIEPLPDYLIHDSRYRKFLRQFGLESLDDLKDMSNTLTVHLEVRRQLRELEERRQPEE